MQEIIVNTKNPYCITIAAGLLSHESLITFCANLAHEWVILTDDIVNTLYARALQQHLAKHFKVNLISIPAGEEHKTRETKAQIEDKMQSLGCGRDCGILAVGGGVITDLSGFVAATYCRGIPAVYIPTTLLAMVDATVGGKTGINTPYGKNLIGTFTQPRAVFIDTDVLTTLDNENFCNGVIESIKHALIADADFFQFLDTHADKIMQKDAHLLSEIITRSINIKRQIIEADEFEYGQRAICNFGHTIGHAIETYSNYTISHGAAVAIGMVYESHLSTLLSGLTQIELEKIKQCLTKYNVRLTLNDDEWNSDAIKILFERDKKVRNGQAHFVLLSAIGVPYISASGYTTPIDESQTLNTLNLISAS
ncbi:MAG: 3-dehydroquinate synthase [Pseudomonadota bacterium]|nr:3-dehydroquinate synthase [Pseudomonadota bacterium]